MQNLNPRKYMELAIKTMHESVVEPRNDGKVTPKVGAVLVEISDDLPKTEIVITAYRGELRHGDHAEFTLLERKCRDKKLDNCVLFATLEPCAPDSRKFPKLSCAERIILARIKKVWIGIADPDPTVDRKGIKYLQDNGVEVLMFDRDLQSIIHSENQAFIEQASERAASENESKDVVLSPLEAEVVHTDLTDLSPEALQAYCSRIKIKEPYDSPEVSKRLMQQNLLKSINSQIVPTGFGMLLFGKQPRNTLQQAGLLATIHYAGDTEEVKDFEGPQIFVPQDLHKWLTDKLPNVINRTEAQRTHKNDSIFELVREGVVNALVHRDYDIIGAKCQIIITPNTITIKSPGKPILPITIENLQSFNAPMLSRNPILHYVFAKMDLAEERGLGLKSMRTRATQDHLPLPRFSWEDPYLVLTIALNSLAATSSLRPETVNDLSESEKVGWQWLVTKGKTKSSEYATEIGLDTRSARRHLNHFVELGIARQTGSGPATEYKVV